MKDSEKDLKIAKLEYVITQLEKCNANLNTICEQYEKIIHKLKAPKPLNKKVEHEQAGHCGTGEGGESYYRDKDGSVSYQ